MKRQRVASSTIQSVGYDADRQILQVETCSGNMFTFCQVPLTAWHFLMAAPSKGQFFNQNIKHHYPTR